VLAEDRSPEDPFAALNDYDVRHLVAHLIYAGRDRDVHTLLRLEIGEERRNGGFGERERRGDVGGYLNDVRWPRSATNAWYARLSSVDPSGALFIRDVARAWSAAGAVNAAAAERQQPCPLIGLEMLYALATSSVHSLSSNIPPRLLAALLENRIWTRDQVIAAARQATALGGRVDGLAAVAASLPKADQLALSREALAVVSTGIGSTDDWKPEEAFVRLVPLLPAELLPGALSVARALPDAADRAAALVEVARHVPEPLRATTLAEAIAAARAVEPAPSGYERASALLDIVDSLPEPQRDDTLGEALSMARSLSSADSWRARTLADVADHLAEPARLDVLGEALQAVRAVPLQPVDPASGFHWAQERTMALTQITPKLPALLLDEAVTIAHGLASSYDRDEGLKALVPRLAELGKLDQALVAFRAIEDKRSAGVLANAAERLTSVADLRAVLSAARDVDGASNSSVLASVSAKVAPRLARQGLHAEANSITQTIDDPWLRLQVCAELAQILPQNLRGQILDDALTAGQSDRVQRLLADHIGELSDEPIMRLALCLAADGQFDRALAAARTFPQRGRYGGAGPRAEALGLLAPHLPEEARRGVLLEALAAAHLVGDVYHQVCALAAWAALHPAAATDQSECVTRAFRSVLEALPTVSDDQQRYKALILLAPHVPESMLGTSLHIARAFESADLRTVALTTIAVRMSAPDRTLVMAEALESIKAIGGAREAAPVLAQVVPEFPTDQQRYVLQVALRQNAVAQRTLLPHICADLPDDLKREALSGIALVEDVNARTRALIQMASVLSEAEQSALLADLASLEDPREIGEALARLSANLAEPVLPQAVAVARDLPDPVGRATALARLVLRLAAVHQLEQALELVGEINWELNDTDPVDFGANLWAQAITMLAEFIPPDLRPGIDIETLAAAQAISRGWVRAQVVSALSLFVDLPVADGLFQAEVDKLYSADPVDERSKMLVAMAPRLPERLLPAAMAAACTIADSGYLYVSLRADALAALSKRLPVLPKADLYLIWRDSLHLLAGCARDDLLWDLGALAPVVRALGVEDTPAGAIGTVDRIARWWP
jgi:hypothetical protein